MIESPQRNLQMVREWFSSLAIRDRNRLVCMACCSNPNAQLYTDAQGNTYMRCANCMCKV